MFAVYLNKYHYPDIEIKWIAMKTFTEDKRYIYERRMGL